MISIQQWRARIGCFCARHRKHSKLNTLVVSSKPIRIGLRLLIAVSLCLVLAGDVETNPGPDGTLLTELKEFRIATEKNFENLKKDINSIRLELSDLKGEITRVKTQVEDQVRDMDRMYDDLHGEIYSLKHSMSRLQERAENQERYTRRDNVLLYNVKEDMNESQSTTCEKVVKLLNQCVPSRTWSKSDFVRMHRLKTKTSGNQPIILRLFRSTDKLELIKARGRFKQQDIGVGNDLTLSQREELKALREEGKFGYFKNGKLHFDKNKEFTNNSQSQPGSQANVRNTVNNDGVASSQQANSSFNNQDERTSKNRSGTGSDSRYQGK